MSVEKLESVTVRLEKVADRLESVSLGAKMSSSENSQIVEECEKIVSTSVARLQSLSDKIGGEVSEGTKVIQKGFQRTVELLKVAATTKKPSTDSLSQVFKPLGDVMEELKAFASKNYNSKFKPHLEALSSTAGSFGWVQMAVKPQNFIGEMIDSGTFYANRVLKDFKDVPYHKEWVAELKKTFQDLKDYVGEYHAMGLSWNPKGADFVGVSSESSGVSAPKPTPGGGGAKGPADVGALFASISKGSNITSGLKKVDDSMKTHKNPELRSGSKVAGSPPSKTAPSTTKATTTAQPPRYELDGKKWMIENQREEKLFEITDGDISYSVILFNCVNSLVKISNKLNQLSLVKCTNCKVQVMNGLISCAEVTNSKKVEIHADGVLPFVNINSSDSVQVYLNDKSAGAAICTIASTSVNVALWKGDDLIERPVPEVFVSRLVGTELVTEISQDA